MQTHAGIMRMDRKLAVVIGQRPAFPTGRNDHPAEWLLVFIKDPAMDQPLLPWPEIHPDIVLLKIDAIDQGLVLEANVQHIGQTDLRHRKAHRMGRLGPVAFPKETETRLL